MVQAWVDKKLINVSFYKIFRCHILEIFNSLTAMAMVAHERPPLPIGNFYNFCPFLRFDS